MQPAELQAETQAWLTGSLLNDAERKIVKAADRLSAVIKCIEEDRGGNREFEAAEAQQLAALHAMHSPRRSISSSTCCPATSRIWTN